MTASEDRTGSSAGASGTGAGGTATRKRLWLFLLAGLLVALALAGIGSGFADGDPDGLNKVAIEQGFADTEKPHALEDSPFAGYGVQGVDNERASVGLAGLAGVTLTFTVGLGLFALVKRRQRSDAPTASPG